MYIHAYANIQDVSEIIRQTAEAYSIQVEIRKKVIWSLARSAFYYKVKNKYWKTEHEIDNNR